LRWEDERRLDFDTGRRRLKCLKEWERCWESDSAYPGDGGLAKSSWEKLKERLG